jgi:hypothetical protein
LSSVKERQTMTYGEDPHKYGGSRTGDPWFRRCPLCHKIMTIVELGESSNRCPKCQTLILA